MKKTIAHITDLHIDDYTSNDFRIDAKKNIMNILDDIVRRNIDTVIITGDFGNPVYLPELFGELQSRNLTNYIALGNHDELRYFKNRSEHADSLMPDTLAYGVEISDTPILVIDTSSNEVGAEQIGIIRDIVTRVGTAILFGHHPVLDCGSSMMDRNYPLKDRERFRDALSGKNTITYFCGHYHTAYEKQEGNIAQYVTPSASFQLKRDTASIELESREYGYRIITIEEKRVTNTEIVMLQ